MRQESQKSKIMKWLDDGNSITPIQALEMFGCFRLAAIIHSIKHQEKEYMEGRELITTMVTNKFGVKYGSYKLKSKKIVTQRNIKERNLKVLGLIV
jgi:hypothetical protein|tara:strand:+ start:509 stop:796 length:288 start_codon:yes stop_codon:yes gene_type:complete